MDTNRSAIKSVGYTTKTHKAGDHIQAAGTCDRCGTGILHVFVVTYVDGLVQNYGSECINKILDAAPTMKSLFNKNAKLLKRYQNYLAILSGPAEDMPRGQEYYGSGLYFIADSQGKDISLGCYFFHPTVDFDKNHTSRYPVKSEAEWLQRTSKDIEQGKAKLAKEITRLETFLARILVKGSK